MTRGSRTIWVVRHGRTEANASGLLLGRADPDLDDIGRRQAEQIAAVLPAGARCLSSPLTRTLETARRFDPEPEVDERLIEMDYGELDLTPVADVPPETWARWRADPDFAPPGGESLADVQRRVNDLLDELSAPHQHIDAHGHPTGRPQDTGHTVLFTHVSPIKAALAWTLGGGPEVSWRAFVAQASVMRIAVSDRGPSLHLFNDTAHLDAS